ncbi:MAG: hypothetical protein ACSHXK_05595 [Oceanococcus sp.]
MLKIAVLLVVVSLSFICWRRISARGNPKPVGVARQAKPAFSAVSVEVGLDCCQAVQEISDQVFLSNTAPQLPVPKCDAASCACRYAFLKDRRDGERRSPVLVLQERFTAPEQWANRGVRGRRMDDIDEAKRSQKVLKDALRQP